MAAIAITSVVAGGFFLLLGILRLGILVRFIPYPVAGGFIAGAGWLLLQGSISVMSGQPSTLDIFPSVVMDPELLKRVLPGLVFGVLLLLVLRRFSSLLLLPVLLGGSIVVFYVSLGLAGVSVQQVLDSGWLLGPFPTASLWPPIGASDLGKVDWGVLFGSAGNMAAVTIMAAITVLLSAPGARAATEQEIDLDRELRATGVANIVTGLFGGMVGYLSLAESSMSFKAGSNSRVSGLVAAAISCVVLFVGADAILYFPRPVLGA